MLADKVEVLLKEPWTVAGDARHGGLGHVSSVTPKEPLLLRKKGATREKSYAWGLHNFPLREWIASFRKEAAPSTGDGVSVL